MGLRTRLVLALVLVAIVPIAAIAWRTGTVLSGVNETLAVAALDRARGVLTERLAEQEASLRRDLDALAETLDGFDRDVRTILDDGGGAITRMRRRRLHDAAADAARARGVDAATLGAGPPEQPLRRRASLSESISGLGDAWPRPGRAHWSWSADGRRLVVRVTSDPLPVRGGPRADEREHLAGERAVGRATLERLAREATGAAVTLGPWDRGAGPPPGSVRRARISVDGRVVPADRPIDATPVALVTLTPLGESGPVRALRSELVRVALAGVALAVLAGLLLAELLSRPLRRLTRAVSAVADGEPVPGAMPGGSGEVGRLAGAVDRMLAAIATEHRGRLAAERRGAWQEIAQRVAHEVRNPLSPIRLAVSNIRRARERATGPGDVGHRGLEGMDEELAAIEAEVSRLDRLVRDFAEYARLPAPVPADRALADVVGPAVRGQAPGDGRVAIEIVDEPGSPARARVDADLFGQALANLAKNAVQAFEERGGRIRVTLRAARADSREAAVVIEDDGPGIPDEIRERMFEPYVTGRGDAGTGLGLALTRRIVTEHGGTIEADSSPLGGARFTIRLPAGGRPKEDS